jgi:heterodisulfide reductase subunit B
MKRFAYFPGCSLEKMARSYHLSALATSTALGVQLEELDDWNCCGATAYFHVDELLADTLCARNLAMAEKQGLDLVAPCAACYKNSYFANQRLIADRDLADHVNFALEEDDLRYEGSVAVRHLLEVFVEEIGVEAIKARVTRPLAGLKVAAYYGCQIMRPRKASEDVEQPRFFEELVAATGAEPTAFAGRLTCCSGSLIVTNRQAALSMVANLLQNAVANGAAVIATACPLCQVNLECYQKQVNQEYGTDYSVPVLFFTQLVGLALGMSADQLRIGTELVPTTSALQHAPA